MLTRFPLPGVFAAALVALSVAVGAAACSNQGEGDRCDTNADNGGNDDCQDGLVCTSKSSLGNSNTDLCCPPDRTQATTAACALGQSQPLGDAAPAPGTDAGEDAAQEASTDAGGDETTPPMDAATPMDASDDGG